jgi:hypothetical protein
MASLFGSSGLSSPGFWSWCCRVSHVVAVDAGEGPSPDYNPGNGANRPSSLDTRMIGTWHAVCSTQEGPFTAQRRGQNIQYHPYLTMYKQAITVAVREEIISCSSFGDLSLRTFLSLFSPLVLLPGLTPEWQCSCRVHSTMPAQLQRTWRIQGVVVLTTVSKAVRAWDLAPVH